MGGCILAPEALRVSRLSWDGRVASALPLALLQLWDVLAVLAAVLKEGFQEFLLEFLRFLLEFLEFLEVS